MVAIIQPDSTAPLFSVRAAVMGGLLAEDPSTNGASNLIAHLLTSGTTSRTASSIALEIDGLAASMSGFSGRNTLGLRMTALSRDLAEALEIFADSLLHSSFSPDELERARREVLAEIAAQRDNLGGSAFRLFSEQAYAGHPYAMSVLGTADSVGSLDQGELIEIYQRTLQPSRLVVSIVGDVDPGSVIATLGRLLQDTAPAAPRGAEPSAVAPREPGLISLGEHRDRQQTHIVLGFATEALTGEFRYAFDVLSAILGGQGGRLFVELRDRQSLAYSVNAYASAGLDAGSFAFYIATSPTKVEQALEGIRAEIERLAEDGVTDDEVERAQRFLVGRRDIGLQRLSARAGYFTFDELYGRGYSHGYGYAERVNAVTAAQIRDAVRRYFQPELGVQVIVGPGGPGVIAAVGEDPE
jgi:zinc protease